MIKQSKTNKIRGKDKAEHLNHFPSNQRVLLLMFGLFLCLFLFGVGYE